VETQSEVGEEEESSWRNGRSQRVHVSVLRHDERKKVDRVSAQNLMVVKKHVPQCTTARAYSSDP
jgi:hypothetical protein